MQFMALRYSIARRLWILRYSVWSIIYDAKDGYLWRRVKRWLR